MLKKFIFIAKMLGYYPYETYSLIRGLPWYLRDYKKLKQQLKNFPSFPLIKFHPILYDRTSTSGVVSGHYFHQDLLIAQKIFNSKPEKHVDVASRIDGFVAHVASFMPIEVFDIRKLAHKVDNIKFIKADLMNIDCSIANYTSSISCLHSIEHFGLGRYNDPIDAEGHLKGINSIHRILKPGGTFYFSSPIGPQRIEFNAQRVFSLAYIIPILKEKFTIKDFSYVDDTGDLHKNVHLTEEYINTNFHCFYGCGIFELIKK